MKGLHCLIFFLLFTLRFGFAQEICDRSSLSMVQRQYCYYRRHPAMKYHLPKNNSAGYYNVRINTGETCMISVPLRSTIGVANSGRHHFMFMRLRQSVAGTIGRLISYLVNGIQSPAVTIIKEGTYTIAPLKMVAPEPSVSMFIGRIAGSLCLMLLPQMQMAKMMFFKYLFKLNSF